MEPEAHTQSRLLSQEAAARYLGVSKWTLRDLLFRGDIPYVKIGRRLLIDVQDLDAYITQSKIQHGP
jgi:excisionase family DNA binding protein